MKKNAIKLYTHPTHQFLKGRVTSTTNTTKSYRVTINISNRGNIIDYFCECEYHKQNNKAENHKMCKHVAGTILLRINQKAH